jgi:low temperature requirement protein LtrA
MIIGSIMIIESIWFFIGYQIMWLLVNCFETFFWKPKNKGYSKRNYSIVITQACFLGGFLSLYFSFSQQNAPLANVFLCVMIANALITILHAYVIKRIKDKSNKDK